MADEGTFLDSNGNELRYEVIRWNEHEGEPWKTDTDDIPLTKVENINFKIEDSDGGVAYTTLVGEWENWESVEIAFEYMFSEESDTNISTH